MPYVFSLLILMAVSLVLPANGHASSYERSNRAEPATRAQTPCVQPPFYVPVICGFTKYVSGAGGRMPRAWCGRIWLYWLSH